MKLHLIASLSLLLAVSVLRGEDTTSSESNLYSATFTSKVLKTYPFQDGDFQYTAYVITWKEREVVVLSTESTDPKFAVGETINCQVQQHRMRTGEKLHTRMTFSLRPAEADGDTRREEIIEELRARRAKRGAAQQP